MCLHIIYNWDLPGGKSEKNESAEETAKREVMEEIGLDITVGKLTGIYYDPSYDIHHFVFTASNDPNQKPQPSSPEILECKYFPIGDLPKPISDFTSRRIQDSLNNKKQLFHVIGPRQWIE